MKCPEHGVSSLILSQNVDTEVAQLAEKRSVGVYSGQNGPLHPPHGSRRVDEQAASGLEVLVFPS